MMQYMRRNTKIQKHQRCETWTPFTCNIRLKVSPFAKLSIKPALRSSSSSREFASEPEPGKAHGCAAKGLGKESEGWYRLQQSSS